MRWTGASSTWSPSCCAALPPRRAVGVVQGRWADCSSNPIPSARKVAVADVAGALPADTPRITAQEREHTIRERRAQYQQRVLW